ncbi:unnamed protein product [Parajaminaea phylloscopi]
MGAASSSIDPERYAVLGLTHVQYDPADPLAKLLALVTLSPIFLLCSYVTIILYRRELTFINALIGQLACEGVNWGLKRLIRQPRPTGHLGKGYGMPSSHCQFLGFFCSFFLAHFYLHHPRAAKPRTLVNTMRRLEHWLAMLSILALTALTCYSRWHLSYHSTSQVAVGITIGLLLGSAYYYTTEYLPRQPMRLPAPLGSPVSSPSSSPVAASKSRDATFSSKTKHLSTSVKTSSARLRQFTQSAAPTAPFPGDGEDSYPSQPSGSHHKRRRSSLAGLMPELHPAPPLRQLILDHPLAVALRLRDSWTVWLDGGIEGEYEAWRAQWERRRPSLQRQDIAMGSGAHSSIAASLGLVDCANGTKTEPSREEIAFFAGNEATQTDARATQVVSQLPPASTATASSSTTTSAEPHYTMILRTLQLASQCPPTSTAFCVGCVIAVRGTDQILATGYSRETGDAANEHAEQVALGKLTQARRAPLLDVHSEEVQLDLYTSMEPCSERLSGALPCVQRVLAWNRGEEQAASDDSRSDRSLPRLRITRVFQALSEPADFIAENTSSSLLRSHDIELLTVLPPLQAGLDDADQGWIEREALRLAKKGHLDQPRERGGESLGWKGVPL